MFPIKGWSGGTIKQTITALIACSSQIWIGGGFVSMFNMPGVSEEQRGLLVATSQVIELLTIWPGVWMSSLLGKRAILQLAALPTITAYILLTQVDHIVDLFIARALQGVSSGLVCGVLPLYLIDISVEGCRESSEYMHTSFWYLGVCLIYATAPFISYLPLTIILLTLTLVWALGMCWVPESPWYYFDRGREAKALESLSWLRGSQDVARREYDSTVSSRIQSSWRELVSKQVVVLSVLGILHWAFVPARLAYSYRNFLSITNSDDASIGIQLGQAVLCFVASTLSTFLLAWSMRRTLIIRSLILALLSSIPTSVYLYNMYNRDSDTQIYVDSVAIGLIVLYPVLSSAAFHTTTYVLSQEILYKDKHRKVAIYLAHLAAFLSAVSCIIVPILQRMDRDYINFSILSGVAFISLVFIFSCFPETKNKHIFEINRLFKS